MGCCSIAQPHPCRLTSTRCCGCPFLFATLGLCSRDLWAQPLRWDIQCSAGWWRAWSCSSPWCLLCSRRCPGEVEVSPRAQEQCSACPTLCHRGPSAALPVGTSPRSCQGRGCSCSTQMPGTFCLTLPQGANSQAPRAACRHVHCLEKHTEICDRKGVAVETRKGLGKRLSSLLEPLHRMLPVPPPGPSRMDAAATAQR